MDQKHWRYMRPLAVALALAALVTFAPQARADEIVDDFEVPVIVEREEVVAVEECPECPEGPNLGRVSFNVGMDIPTRYYFRGILQEDEGFIGQPYAEVNFNLLETDSMNVTLIGGTWFSLHSMHTKEPGGSRARDAAKSQGISQRTSNPNFGDPESFYEFDAYGGAAFGWEDLELSTIFTTYLSPSGAFSTVQDIAFGLAYDDSSLLGDFALNPSMTIYRETSGTAFGTRKGTNLTLAGGPEFGLTGGDNPITLTIPLELGLNLDNYYETKDASGNTKNPTFGYFQTGLDFGFPLTFMPKEYGSWLFNAGWRFISLGDTLADANRKGDDYSFFGIFGLSMTY